MFFSGVGTAKRLRLKAQGCFNPGFKHTSYPTQNGLRLGPQPLCGWLDHSNSPRVAEAATLGYWM